MSHDAIVIGGGIIGCSTAWHLARRGARVTVLEREARVGLGSTARSTAIVRQRYSHEAAMALALEGLREWERWSDRVPPGDQGKRASLRNCGVLFLLPAGEPSTPQLARSMRQVGIVAEQLDRDALAQRFPTLQFDADESVEGLYEPEGGYVDAPEQATRDVARAAAAAGANIVTGARVREVLTEWRDGGLSVRGVRTDANELLEAPTVINCAGPHSGWVNLVARSPLALQTAPLRQVVLHATATSQAERLAALPVIADLRHGYYLRPDPERLRIGAVWPEDETEWIAEADAHEPTAERAVLQRRLEAARKRVPWLEPDQIMGLVGLYDVTVQDWYPIVDRTDTRGYFVAIGTSGAWFKAAPVIGWLASEVVTANVSGRNTDAQPLELTLPNTGYRFPMSLFSRRRTPVPLAYGGGVLG
ncbi:MAG: FAD-binding oxidoreductase [Candidatus Eisenbacteria bacterium]|uniref:FAD-binding oxidoreductase n=1 Tax=Eiseniibacteriota bacterium TaxID=2212470 RepID=A0A849SJA9_UNCEI|nr:FAD-binding oxidoreductase [Candidatus Eisenbacteria bacterium]